MRNIIVIMAPPAGGKGTQAKKIMSLLNIAHLSTGDMLRHEVKKGTPVGLEAGAVMESGGLVKDELVIEIIRSRIQEDDCKYGFILDGFPRTLVQAEELSNMLEKHGEHVTKVIHLEVPDEVVVKRITGRWIHKPSGRSYHTLWNKPESLVKAGEDAEPSGDNMFDDLTGEPLIQRKDDTAEAAVERIAKYKEETFPSLDYFTQRGKADILKINGDQGIEEVTADVKKQLQPKAFLDVDDDDEVVTFTADEFGTEVFIADEASKVGKEQNEAHPASSITHLIEFRTKLRFVGNKVTLRNSEVVPSLKADIIARQLEYPGSKFVLCVHVGTTADERIKKRVGFMEGRIKTVVDALEEDGGPSIAASFEHLKSTRFAGLVMKVWTGIEAPTCEQGDLSPPAA